MNLFELIDRGLISCRVETAQGSRSGFVQSIDFNNRRAYCIFPGASESNGNYPQKDIEVIAGNNWSNHAAAQLAPEVNFTSEDLNPSFIQSIVYKDRIHYGSTFIKVMKATTKMDEPTFDFAVREERGLCVVPSMTGEGSIKIVNGGSVFDTTQLVQLFNEDTSFDLFEHCMNKKGVEKITFGFSTQLRCGNNFVPYYSIGIPSRFIDQHRPEGEERESVPGNGSYSTSTVEYIEEMLKGHDMVDTVPANHEFMTYRDLKRRVENRLVEGNYKTTRKKKA